MAREIKVVGVPEAITDAQVLEWVSVLVERYENAKVNQIQAVKDATESAKTSIDAYRTANTLTAKFAKPVEEVG